MEESSDAGSIPASSIICGKEGPACREDSLSPTQTPIRTCSDSDASASRLCSTNKEGMDVH